MSVALTRFFVEGIVELSKMTNQLRYLYPLIQQEQIKMFEIGQVEYLVLTVYKRERERGEIIIVYTNFLRPT